MKVEEVENNSYKRNIKEETIIYITNKFDNLIQYYNLENLKNNCTN